MRNFLLICVFFTFSILSFGQKKPIEFDEFSKYKKLGYHVSGISFRKQLFEGDEIITKSTPIFSGRIGVDFVFNPERVWTFKTALYFELIPGLKVEYAENVPDADLIKSYYRPALSSPFLIELKMQMDEKIFVGVSGGVELTLGYRQKVEIDIYRDNIYVPAVWGSDERLILNPGLRIGPSIYYTGNKALYQFSFGYKKSVINYSKGTIFSSAEGLKQSSRLTGDYLSLGMTIFFK